MIDDHKDTFNIVHNPIDVTIYGYKGSTAQSYAEKYSYQFKLICTYPATPAIGDLDSNGTVNAKDANEVLIVAAEIGTRRYIGLTEVQQKAADVNLDGSINAKDAAWILRYAAAVGTGTVSGTLEEYMEEYRNNG